MRWGKGRAGFLLLEVIPAMLLLAAVSLLGARLLRLSTEMCWRAGELDRATGSFSAVLKSWDNSASRAALAVYAEPDGLEVVEFPDSSWFPDSIQADGRSRCLWRRAEYRDADGRGWWTIEYRIPGMEEWRWFSRVPGNFPDASMEEPAP